ncbi:SH3 domain-containing protein [Rhodovulum sp. ES.010]|uniref:SH3 domain-containing protein n=1 Tax=Rhodovulum sp. ES.010 TaxID=1882821 RepID=UPI00092A7FF5|nr:SH3 domain-containing protein [Rhodovulum sp. ES.010]SIO44148.1 SH3 domain-containing protein [Rhodovulum sp. ES.010]
MKDQWQVIINRNAARRGESTTYTLDIRIDGAAAGSGQDFADGLSGGPDYWEVTGVSGSLNIRAAPSTSAAVRMGLLRGTVVRNLGCRMNEGRRWCEVAQVGGGVTGWAAGEYLREAAAPSQPTVPSAGSGSAAASNELLDAAHEACLRDVRQVTNNPTAFVLRSMFSEAGTEVIVGVGDQSAPWRCIAYRDGTTAGIMSITDEGSL